MPKQHAKGLILFRILWSYLQLSDIIEENKLHSFCFWKKNPLREFEHRITQMPTMFTRARVCLQSSPLARNGKHLSENESEDKRSCRHSTRRTSQWQQKSSSVSGSFCQPSDHPYVLTSLGSAYVKNSSQDLDPGVKSLLWALGRTEDVPVVGDTNVCPDKSTWNFSLMCCNCSSFHPFWPL